MIKYIIHCTEILLFLEDNNALYINTLSDETELQVSLIVKRI